MEFRVKSKKVELKNINHGDLFKYGNCIYIKTKEVELCKDTVCVVLSTGSTIRLGADILVTRLKGYLTFEE